MFDVNQLQLSGTESDVILVRKDRFTNLASVTVYDEYQLPEASGSREHYFHFLLGYFLPIIHEQRTRSLRHFGVLDCGPLMTPILVRTLSRLELSFEVMQKGRTASYVVVPSWDQELGFMSYLPDIYEITRIVKDCWSNEVLDCLAESCPRTTTILLSRSPSHSFYENNGAAEIRTYGQDRRSILNWTEVSNYLTEKGINHDIYEPGVHSLSCQINIFKKAIKIVGMRGAEFANLIWSECKPQILVFNPYKHEGPISYISRGLGIRNYTVQVEQTHTRIDADTVAQFILMS